MTLFRTKLLTLVCLSLPGLSITLAPTSVEAIPAFARAYNVPCSTCHVAITRRSEFGDVFRKNGYRWPGDVAQDAKAKRNPPTDLKGVGTWLGHVDASLPIGVAATLSASSTNNPGVPEAVTLGTPSLNFLFGTSLGEHFSVFGTWAGKGTPNELYLHATRLFDRPELNLRIGQFEQTTTMFKNNEALIGRFMLTTRSVHGFSVGLSRLGAELNGTVADRLFYAVGAVQNAGVGSPVDAYYSLSYKLGGMDFLGEEPDMDLDAEPSYLDHLSVTFGHWGYFGSVEQGNQPIVDLMRFGADMKLHWKAWSLWSGVMLGLDRDLRFNTDADSLTVFGELSYAPTSFLHLSYLYQAQDVASESELVQQHDAGLIWLVQENIRARLRFGFSDDKADNEVAELQLLIGF